MDAMRSFFFIALGFGAIWFFVLGKLKQNYLAAILGILILVDLWGVDKRFLNEKDYEKRKTEQPIVEKTPADEFILQDTDPHYRVYNTTQRLDQDALTSYYHKSIGGYHGAKMRRYQELIQYQIAKQNMEIFNMLNVKYFLIGDSVNNLYPQKNPEARGNAWFVKRFVVVENADAELDSLSRFNANQTCFIDKRFSNQLDDLTIVPDSTATIKLITYQPNKLVYTSTATASQLAVFSEVYYENGWNAYIDGVLTPHLRCNYVLRGLKIPKGNHTIEFKFEPKLVAIGETVSLVSSILLYGGIVVVAFGSFMNSRKQSK
jgi:hypothetical protein